MGCGIVVIGLVEEVGWVKECCGLGWGAVCGCVGCCLWLRKVAIVARPVWRWICSVRNPRASDFMVVIRFA